MSYSLDNITRPDKIRWRFIVKNNSVLESIPSKSLRKFLRSSDEILAATGITWTYKPLSEADYLEWLPYYTHKMSEKHFDVFADKEWYQKKLANGQTVEGIFFHQGEKMVASCIIVREGKTKAVLSFKASEKLDLSNKQNSSIGAVVDYFFIREMYQNNVEIISSGMSRNNFGVINTFGYLEFKLRIGYEPSLADNATLETSVELDEQGRALFYGFENEQWTLFGIRPENESFPFAPEYFATSDTPYKNIVY